MPNFPRSLKCQFCDYERSTFLYGKIQYHAILNHVQDYHPKEFAAITARLDLNDPEVPLFDKKEGDPYDGYPN